MFSILFSFFVFIFLFSILILVHECGHFFAAKFFGVKVEEFGLGLGKKIFGKKIGETEFTINAVPMGGFVQMLGEEKSSTDPRSFDRQKIWKKMVITLAGIFFNFIFAIFSLTILFSVGANPIIISKKDFSAALEKKIISIKKTDSGEKIIYNQKIKKNFPAALIFSFSETARISAAIVEKVASLPGYILKNKKFPRDIGGPVAIAQVTHKIVPFGFLEILKFTALLSISLAIMNLLPIPALDGGRFLFQIAEFFLFLFGKKMNPKIENAINYSGFLFLMLFFVAVTWNDISRIFFS